MFKIFATIRYQLYREVKKLKKQNSSFKAIVKEEDMNQLIESINIDKIRKEAFNLFEINTGLDAQLSLKQIEFMNQDDQFFNHYNTCLKEAHDRFTINYIFMGELFSKME